MARGAGEPSAKRAKVDEADKEEDPLVRRKEEVVRLLERARAKGKGRHSLDWYRWVCDTFVRARAKEELLTLCTRLEAKNEKNLTRLPPEMWQKILDGNLHQNDLLAFAMTCRFFREKQKGLGKKLKTNVNPEHLNWWLTSGKMVSHSLGWFQWVCDTFEILPGFKWPGYKVKGAVSEGNLVNYSALQGSVEILRWLMEEKGYELNEDTDWRAGMGGSIEVLEYLLGRSYEFNEDACHGAARGGHLEALKHLRGLDPPCPWDIDTCKWAAGGGHLEVLMWARAQEPPCPWNWQTCYEAAQEGRLDVLKWARSQDPPCPWGETTCSGAAYGGHLDVLNWLRSQDPPCPWNERTCSAAVEGGHLEVLKWARDQDPPCPWNDLTCAGATLGGRLEILKWLRSQDPPCPWDTETCSWAAEQGHLEVLKWARDQDPPCPWNVGTCFHAAWGGQLEALKWLRAQDPPCPWRRHKCRKRASREGQQHVIDWIDQQEDESDVEFYDSDSERSYDSYDDEYF